MIDFLGLVLAAKQPALLRGMQDHFAWEWLAEGVLSLTPKQDLCVRV